MNAVVSNLGMTDKANLGKVSEGIRDSVEPDQWYTLMINGDDAG